MIHHTELQADKDGILDPKQELEYAKECLELCKFAVMKHGTPQGKAAYTILGKYDEQEWLVMGRHLRWKVIFWDNRVKDLEG